MYAVSAADKNKKIDKKADLKTLASGIYSIFGLLYAIIMYLSPDYSSLSKRLLIRI